MTANAVTRTAEKAVAMRREHFRETLVLVNTGNAL